MKACMICVATRGIKGSDLIKGAERDLDEDEAFARHIESEHHIPVKRHSETTKQCEERFAREYPEAGNPETCKCPECSAKRRQKTIGRNRYKAECSK